MRRFRLMAAVAVVFLLASCGDDADTAAPSPSPTSAKQRVRDAVVPARQLPAKWRPAPVREHVEKPGLPRYCGVTALPKPLAAARVDLYARTSTGPFLLQYTALAGDEAAAKAVLTKLTKVARTCHNDTNGDARYRVRRAAAPGVGEQSVGLHYRGQNGFTSGVVVFRRGAMVVTVVDIGPPAVPYATVRQVAGTADIRIS